MRTERGYAKREVRDEPLIYDAGPMREVCAALIEGRRCGGEFETAWLHAIDRMPPGQWRQAMEATRDEWERCWHGRPSLGRKIDHVLTPVVMGRTLPEVQPLRAPGGRLVGSRVQHGGRVYEIPQYPKRIKEISEAPDGRLVVTFEAGHERILDEADAR